MTNNNLTDIQAYDEIKLALAKGEQELIPSSVVDALLDGENPIRIWREYRGMSQVELADQAGISKSYLSQLESGRRTGTAEVLAKIANLLDIIIDDLLSNDESQ